jgi:hypothetical protein
MTARRKISPMKPDRAIVDPAITTQAHLGRIVSLREARIHHRAITLELRSFYDSVAAEAVPESLVNLFDRDAEK